MPLTSSTWCARGRRRRGRRGQARRGAALAQVDELGRAAGVERRDVGPGRGVVDHPRQRVTPSSAMRAHETRGEGVGADPGQQGGAGAGRAAAAAALSASPENDSEKPDAVSAARRTWSSSSGSPTTRTSCASARRLGPGAAGRGRPSCSAVPGRDRPRARGAGRCRPDGVGAGVEPRGDRVEPDPAGGQHRAPGRTGSSAAEVLGPTGAAGKSLAGPCAAAAASSPGVNPPSTSGTPELVGGGADGGGRPRGDQESTSRSWARRTSSASRTVPEPRHSCGCATARAGQGLGHPGVDRVSSIAGNPAPTSASTCAARSPESDRSTGARGHARARRSTPAAYRETKRRVDSQDRVGGRCGVRGPQ